MRGCRSITKDGSEAAPGVEESRLARLVQARHAWGVQRVRDSKRKEVVRRNQQLQQPWQLHENQQSREGAVSILFPAVVVPIDHLPIFVTTSVRDAQQQLSVVPEFIIPAT